MVSRSAKPKEIVEQEANTNSVRPAPDTSLEDEVEKCLWSVYAKLNAFSGYHN